MKRSHKEDRRARLYDAEILPLWTRRFGKLLLRDLALPQKAMVLDVGCGTGYPALELLEKMDGEGRIVAIDPSSSMLDEARKKAGALAGKRIFFRTEAHSTKLSFTDEVYDLVVCNARDLDDPSASIAEFARVCKRGGRVAITLALAGTFHEFYDLFREVLAKRDQKEALERLDAHLARYVTLDDLEAWFEDAGLSHVTVARETFTLLFKSSREFFFAPVIEHGPLSAWKAIAGKGEVMQDIFTACKNAIDAYFAARPFSVTVEVGAVRGRKQAHVVTAAPPPADEDVPTGEVALVTADLEPDEDEENDGTDDDEPDEPIL
jgi:ubiquinone/menaquinone biosynthesis C-methylase UbiE